MQLSLDRPEGYFFIRAISAQGIVVVDRELQRSFIMTPERVIEDWPVHTISDFNAAAVDQLLQLDPELILLGTGARQIFPDRSLLLPLLRRSIGVEVMDNGAASRTYNLLAGEGRHVAAAFILETTG